MQTYTFADVNDSVIRSSKLKTLEGCSYLYWATYIQGIPVKNNSGAEKGSICHDILEWLAEPNRKDIFEKIIETGSVFCHSEIKTSIAEKISKSHTLKPDQETLDHINDMIITGMKCDFWVAGGEIIAHEYKFDITNKDPYYKIRGFFDKVAVKGDYIIIHDYKSSKRKFVGEDRESNIQALIYLLAAKKLWPDKKAKLIFIFLAYPDDPMMEIEYSDNVLSGFETYLNIMQDKIDKFVYKDATSGFAADITPPESGEFKGQLLCGYSRYKGQLKKDGTVMFACPVKWGFEYYKVLDNTGKVMYTSLYDDIVLEDGQKLEKVIYSGCPRFNRPDPLEGLKSQKLKEFDPLKDF